ncbi:hypothetical protein FRB99_004266 [Tulasnella sp. 403]|nr:hypothetical protein FRB99_004266 [Tulasnella sp. 403]
MAPLLCCFGSRPQVERSHSQEQGRRQSGRAVTNESATRRQSTVQVTNTQEAPPDRIVYPPPPGAASETTKSIPSSSKEKPTTPPKQDATTVRLGQTVEECEAKQPGSARIVGFNTALPISNGLLGGLFQAHTQGSSEGTVALRKTKVLISRLPPSRKETVGKMGRSWERLEDRYVVPFWGFGADAQGFLYFASPWAKDGSLADWVRAHPDGDRVKYLEEAAAALWYLHSRQPPIVHGNVKAQNILIWGDHASLCDLVPPTFNAFGLTRVPRGTHLSPDVTAGALPTPASDVFAFGLTIYEVLKGETPPRNPQNIAAGLEARIPDLEKASGHKYAVSWGLAQQCWRDAAEQRPSMQAVSTQLSESRPKPKPTSTPSPETGRASRPVEPLRQPSTRGRAPKAKAKSSKQKATAPNPKATPAGGTRDAERTPGQSDPGSSRSGGGKTSAR